MARASRAREMCFGKLPFESRACPPCCCRQACRVFDKLFYEPWSTKTPFKGTIHELHRIQFSGLLGCISRVLTMHHMEKSIRLVVVS